MFEDLNKKLKKDPELRKYYQQEKLILDVTELISKLMLKEKVSKIELAKRLNMNKSYVTQFLEGTTNMTLRTIADVFTVLDSELVVNDGKRLNDKQMRKLAEFVSKQMKFIMVRLFGKKCVTVDSGYKLTAYFFKGIMYITGFKQING